MEAFGSPSTGKAKRLKTGEVMNISGRFIGCPSRYKTKFPVQMICNCIFRRSGPARDLPESDWIMPT